VLLPVIVLHVQLQIKLITGEVNIAEMEIASYGNGYVSRDNRYLGMPGIKRLYGHLDCNISVDIIQLEVI
jgi:hypothetical protein